MKKVLIGIGVLVVLLVATALIAPGFVDWNRIKPEISARAKQATGRDLVVNGDIALSVIPTPRLVMTDVTLSNAPGAAARDMVTLKSLAVRVALAPLLSGKLQVESIALIEPVIELEKLADGSGNWEFAPAGADAAAAAQAAPADDGGAPPFTVQFDNVSVENATVVYRDAASGSVERLESIDAQVAAASLSGPFALVASVEARGEPIQVELKTGRLDASGVPIRLVATVAGADAKLDFDGSAKDLDTDPKLTGGLKVEGSDLAKLAAIAGGADLPPLLAQPFALNGLVSAGALGADLNDLALSLGDNRATGGVNVAFGDILQVDLALAVPQVDLDTLLAGQGTVGAGDSTASDAADGDSQPAADAAEPAAFALPTGLAVEANLTIDAVQYRGSVVKNAVLSVGLNNGELTISQASAQLPGGSEFSAFGFVAAEQGRPKFDGEIEARSDDLRGLLGWLDVDVGAVPADRLRKLVLTGKVDGNDQQIQIGSVDLTLDSSHLIGAATIVLRERPGIGLSLRLDRMNLDAYLPKGDTPSASTAGGAADGGAAPGGDAAGGDQPLAVLEEIDANFKIEIGELTVRETPVRDIKVDGTLQNGTLTLRQASIRNLAGVAVSVAATANGFTSTPAFNVNYDLAANNLSKFFRLAQLRLPIKADRLGKFSLSGKVKGNFKAITLDTSMGLAGGMMRAKGDVALDALTYDLTVGADHENIARIAGLAGVQNAALGRAGPFSFSARLAGDLTKVKIQDGKVGIAGATVGLSGDLTGLGGAPSYGLALNVSHPNVNKLIRTFVKDFRPAAQDLGPLRIAAQVKGDPAGVAISGLNAAVGPVTVAGDATVKLDGRRPYLNAKLSASEVLADLFLGAMAAPKAAAGSSGGGGTAAGDTGGGAGAPAQRWSRAPVDLTGLAAADADVTLDMVALNYDRYRIDKPQLVLALKDGVLDITKFTGAIFQGVLDATARVVSGKRNQVSARIAADNINLGQAMRAIADSDRADGVISLRADIDTAGASTNDFINALGGNGSVSGRIRAKATQEERATAQGVALLGQILKVRELKTVGGTTNSFLAAFTDAPANLAGTFDIQNGVVRTNDTRLDGTGAQIQVVGAANLPRWLIDADAALYQQQQPDQPYVTAKLTGPLDEPDIKVGGAAVQGGQEKAVSKGLENLLPGLLGGKQEPQQAPQAAPQAEPAPEAQPQTEPAPQAEPEQQPQNPEDLIKNLLKGLQ